MPVVSHGSPITISLPAGEQLTVVADALSSGRLWPFVSRVGDTPGVTDVSASATVTLGPFATLKRYQVDVVAGSLTYTSAPVDFPTADESIAAAIAELPDYAMPVVGTVGDLREVIGAGAPDATAQATLSRDPAGDENALTFTSVAYGAGANDITIEYVDPSANDAVLSVVVTASAIVVNLATGVAGAITSTAAEVLAAIEAEAAAAALVTVAIDTGDTGVADDGSGVVTALAAAAMTGGAGVGIGVAGIGSRYTDITNGVLYLNTGTKSVPVWGALAAA